MRWLTRGGFGRSVTLLGMILFAGYGILAVVLGKTDHKQAAGIAAGILAYIFIMVVGVLWLVERRRRRRPGPVSEEFLMASREVAEMVGSPIRVAIPYPPPSGRGAGQLTVEAFISGPEGSGEATVILARLRGRFQVLTADLSVAGAHRTVAGGRHQGPAQE